MKTRLAVRGKCGVLGLACMRGTKVGGGPRKRHGTHIRVFKDLAGCLIRQIYSKCGRVLSYKST